MDYRHIIVSLFISIWVSGNLHCQPYFYALPDGEETFNRRLARFANDDIVIGDSSDEGATTQASGKVFLTRIDNCGNVLWSYRYERTNEYLEFKDIAVDAKNIIYAYGSAYRGGTELLFLLRASDNGELIDFKLIETGTIDHSSYTLQVRNGIVMLYGLLLDFNTQKQGFVTVFNDNLQFRWARRFAPFESEGDAIIDNAGNYICRSGFSHYAINASGDLLWAKIVDPLLGVTPLAGPFEVTGGYIFQAFNGGFSFLYKLDKAGELVWKSDKFPSHRFAADFQVGGDGNIIAVYKHSVSGTHTPAFIHVESATGNIENQVFLDLGTSIDFEHLYQSVDSKGNVTLIGNKVLIETYPIEIPYFLMQFPLSQQINQCFSLQSHEAASPNDIPFAFNPIDTPLIDAEMQIEPTNANTLVYEYKYALEDHCGFKHRPEVVTTDTALECGKDWVVNLPAQEFTWKDGVQAGTRTIEQPGAYIASNRDCLQPKEYHYILEKPDCECQLYLPNAITANADDINDQFTIYSDCQIEEYHLTIFNRWGMIVYHSRNGKWDGSSQNGVHPPGIYIAKIEYSLRDLGGEIQRGQKMQEVILIR